MQTKTLSQLAAAAGAIVSQQLEKNETAAVRWLAPIEAAAAEDQATCARGALLQLLVAAADIGELCGTTGWDEAALRARHERIEACIISALNFFEQHCGLDRNQVGGAYFAPREYTPQLWQRPSP